MKKKCPVQVSSFLVRSKPLLKFLQRNLNRMRLYKYDFTAKPILYTIYTILDFYNLEIFKGFQTLGIIFL